MEREKDREIQIRDRQMLIVDFVRNSFVNEQCATRDESMDDDLVQFSHCAYFIMRWFDQLTTDVH